MSKWKMVKLGECITLSSGKFLPTNMRVDGHYSVFGGNGINGKHNEYFIKKPTLVIGRVGQYCGCVHTTGENVWVTDNALYVTKFLKALDINYICYALNKKELNRLANKSGQPSISQATILNVKIPIPPIEIQKKIAKTLDTAAELLAMRKRQHAELDNLIKSTFYEMFGDPVMNEKGWDVKKLSELATIKSGGTPSRAHPEYFKGKIPWITTVALGKTLIDERDAVEYISEDAIKHSATKLIKENSLLFGIRVGVGKISINKVPMCTNQDIVAIIDVNSDLLNLIYLLKAINTYDDYFNKQKRGATIKGIKSETLKVIKIPLPPLTLQNKFATIVTKIEEQKDLVKKAIDETQYMFDSLMSQYFD